MGFPYLTQSKVVITTTAAFSANQVIGTGVQSVTCPPGGFIQTVQINLNSTNASQIDICTFTSSMPNTTFTDHSSIAVSSADFAAQGPVINVATWNYMGVNASNGIASGLAYAYPQLSAGTLYFVPVARGAVTANSTNGISVTVTFVS